MGTRAFVNMKAGAIKQSAAVKAISYYGRGQAIEMDGALAAAYAGGIALDGGGVTYDFTARRADLLNSEIMMPAGARDELRTPQGLVDSVARAETKTNATLFRDYVFSIPSAMSHEQGWKTIKEFAQKEFIDKAHGAYLNQHDATKTQKERGVTGSHVHILVTSRGIDENGNWKGKSTGSSSQEMRGPAYLSALRGRWQDHVVDKLREYGFRDIQLDTDNSRKRQESRDLNKHWIESRKDIGQYTPRDAALEKRIERQEDREKDFAQRKIDAAERREERTAAYAEARKERAGERKVEKLGRDVGRFVGTKTIKHAAKRLVEDALGYKPEKSPDRDMLELGRQQLLEAVESDARLEREMRARYEEREV